MPWESASIERNARLSVYLNMKQQFVSMASQMAPTMSSNDRLQWAEERTQETLRTDKNKFEDIVRQTASNMKNAAYPRYRHHYLLEADPYFYYSLTRHLQKHGNLGPNLGNGYFLNKYRRAPHGVKERRAWHPYLGYFWYRLVDFFRPGTSMMTALCFVPLLICVPIVVAFFMFGHVYRLNLLGIICGSTAMLLAPIFLQRSFFGWYDTDPYNYFFPVTILTLFFAGTEEGKRSWIWGTVAGVVTAMYPQFWSGWPFIWFLTFAGGVFGAFVFLLGRKSFYQNPYLWFTVSYFFSSVIFLALFMHPVNMWDSIFEGLFILPKFALTKVDPWPSAFLTVGETRPTSLQKLVYLSGNFQLAGFAVLGVILSLVNVIRQKRLEVFCRWAVMMFIGVMLFRMAIKTERFVVLFVIPFSIFVAFGVHYLCEMGKELIEKKIPSVPTQKVMRAILISFVALVVLPVTIISADVIWRSVRPIMNDTWYDAMIALRDKTPTNAVVHSWWPPGYFIIAVGERGATADGGSQHRMETYWLAKAFVTDDEKTAAGLFRMMSAGGVECMDYLKGLGLRPSQVEKTILEMVPVSRESAVAKTSLKLSPQQENQLLAFTHGDLPPPPSYLFLYNDMIEQNPALTLAATWNVEKAEAIVAQEEQEEKIGFLKQSRGLKTSYLDAILPVIEILRYTPEAELLRQEGSKLYFKNGLSIDLNTMDPLLNLPEKNLNGVPQKLFYMKDGELIEKTITTGNVLMTSALLVKRGDVYTTVIADPKLIRSIMFRLYYLNGEGLKLFKPFFSNNDPGTKTRTVIFEIDWNAFEKESANKDVSTAKETAHATA
ncbi:MAG: hypothetical protein HYZ84_01500 [Candidatus Omnitrophica bacterium]|nr:hypothetical protein [Candidatus Omnitrophota bacterium]